MPAQHAVPCCCPASSGASGAIPEYRRFVEQLKGWVDGPPVIEHFDVVGSYDLFGTQRK